MKKQVLFVIALLFVAVLVGIMVNGCGTSSTSATTTVTVSSTQTNAAKAGVLVANGGSSVGSSAGAVGTSTGARAMMVRALAGGPPASFFTSLLTGSASIDGYLSPTSESFGGNMTPYMRLKTVGGSIVNGAFLTGKKITKWLTMEVQDIMSAGEGSIPNGMTTEVNSLITRYAAAYGAGLGQHPFSDPTFFRAVSTEADYMAWMFMYPSMEVGISAACQQGGGPSRLYMATPEATANDKIGSMDMKMVFGKSATGEITISVNTEQNGKPVAGTYSGSGNLTTPAGTLETTLLMGFTTDGPPSSMKVIGTTESTPKYTVIIYMSPLTMSATGEVQDNTGARVGTLEGSSSGGKVYVGATSEAFSF